MIIDCHTHIFPEEICKNRESFFSDKAFRMLYESEKSKLVGWEGMLAYMDENKIDRVFAMSFPWNDPENCDLHNRYMAESGKLSRGRLLPFAIPHRGAKIHREIKNLKEMGIFGIGELAFYDGGLNDENYGFLEDVFSAACENSMPLCLHVNEPLGHSYPGKYPPDLERVASLIGQFPDLTIILAHWGGGMFIYELMPEIKELFANVWYDTAASPFLYERKIYEIAREILGEKILFGSDYPLLGVKRYIRDMAGGSLSAEHRNSILVGNALSFLDSIESIWRIQV